MKRFLMMMTLIGLVGNWNSTLTAQLVSPDSLYLNEDLPEINIVAVKPLIKAEADKTTYSIAEDPDSRTYTLLEMLRKVPLVTVDGEDNVKVNGQSSFKIYTEWPVPVDDWATGLPTAGPVPDRRACPHTF